MRLNRLLKNVVEAVDARKTGDKAEFVCEK
jgi:hypothetical protein